MHFSRILVTTDFSEASKEAFEVAAYNEKMEGTEIILFHAFQNLEPFLEHTELWTPALKPEHSERYREYALSQLRAFTEKYFHGQKVRCEVMLSPTTPPATIAVYAEREKCELIMMGSRGHSTVGALFIGSTVQRVLLTSKIPVMVVPTGAGH